MTKLAVKLANYLLEKRVIEREDFEIYQYGFEIFLEVSVNVLCSVLIAFLLDMKIECILFFVLFVPLRSYNGGFHMEHYLSCLLLSCATLAAVLLMVKYLLPKPLFSFFLYLIALLLLKAAGPVNHPNRSVDAEENAQFEKRTKLSLFFSLVPAVIFLLTDAGSYLFLEALVFLLLSLSAWLGRFKY